MIFAGRLADHMLLQARQGAEGVDISVMQIELSFGNVAGIIRHRMGNIVAGHRCHREDGDRAGTFEITGFLVAHGQLGIQITQVAAGGRNALQRNADLFHGVRIGRHIRQQHQHPLTFLNSVLFSYRQGHIRNRQPFYNWVGC